MRHCLFRADFEHRGGEACEDCASDPFVQRPPRSAQRSVHVHYGTIASGNMVMKDALERDLFANEMNDVPWLVIRGICDYAYSHKYDDWHRHAALPAAAYAREILHVVKRHKVSIALAWVECLKEGK